MLIKIVHTFFENLSYKRNPRVSQGESHTNQRKIKRIKNYVKNDKDKKVSRIIRVQTTKEVLVSVKRNLDIVDKPR